jgi:hypothetical protein
MSPQEMQSQLLNQRATAFTQQTPDQQLGNLAYKAGSSVGTGLAGAFGVDIQDPMIKRATQIRQMASQFDTNTPEGMAQYAEALRAVDPEMGLQAAQKAIEMRGVAAETKKKELTVSQEAALRGELAALGPNATQAEIMAAVTKYGSADKILTLLQTSADKGVQNQMRVDKAKEDNETKIEAARMAAEAKVEAARVAGEGRDAIARLQIEGRKDVASLIASLKGDKPLTEFQGKALTFGTRAADASNIIGSLEGKYNTVSSAYLPSFMNSTEGQRIQQAQSNFVNAVLRQESGAAIATSEFDNAKKQYFPQYGDKPEVLLQKKTNRERVIKGFSRQAGPAGKDVDEAFNTPVPQIATPSKTSKAFASEAAATAANLPKGTQITINGRKAVVE